MEHKQQIKYNRELLNKIIERDGGSLVGDYESLNVTSTIYFTCKCGYSGSKKFRALYNKGGMRCINCAKENGRKKAEHKCLELYGVKNIFASCEMKEKIQKTYQSKTDEEKQLIIKKRLETTNLKTDEEKNKTIKKRISTHNNKSQEEKKKTVEKRKLTFILKTDDERNLIKQRIKETTFKKYGVECVFKNIEIQNKIKATNLEKYGVENVFQNSEIKDQIIETNNSKSSDELNKIKEKIKQTNRKKYGTDYASQSVSKEEWKNRLV